MSLEIRLLGREFTISHSGTSILLPTRKSFAVLAYLSAQPDVDISREEIAHLLWERSAESQARASLRQELTNIRKALSEFDTSPLEVSRLTVRLNSKHCNIDLHEFKQLAQSNNTQALQKASNLYVGHFLEGFNLKAEPFQNWLSQERLRYKNLALKLQLQLLEHAKENMDNGLIENVARKALEIDNTCETAHRAIMQALYASQHRAEALRQYQSCQKILKQELDVVPSPETEELAAKIKALQEKNTIDLSKKSKMPNTSTKVKQAKLTTPNSLNAQKKSNINTIDTQNTKTSQSKFAKYATLFAALIICSGFLFSYGIFQHSGISPNNPLCLLPIFQANEKKPVQVGMIVPHKKAFGKRQIWGVKKFIQENSAHYPFKVDLKIMNSKGSLITINNILNQLNSREIVSIIGPMQSRLAYEAKIWGNENQIPVITPSASASYLVQPGEKDYFFRVAMSDSIRAKALAEWLRAKNLQNNPYIIHEWHPHTNENIEPKIYGASQAIALKSHLDKVQTIKFQRHDIASLLTATQAVKNDGRAVIIFGYTTDVRTIVKALQSKGIENDIFTMGVALDVLEKEKYTYPERLHVISGVISNASQFVGSQKLRRDFEDENPTLEYDISAYLGYDAAHMIYDAIEQARSETCAKQVTGEMVAKHLRRLPAKKRKIISSSFLDDTQEIFYHSDRLKMVNGKFQRAGSE